MEEENKVLTEEPAETAEHIQPVIITEEIKKQVIAEYLKSLTEATPKVRLSGIGGAAPSSPKNKPKTFAEAAEYAFSKLGGKE